MFLGFPEFFTMIDTEATAHRERGLVLTLTMNSTVILELIRIACVNQFEDLVWGPFLSVNLLNLISGA